MSTAILHAGSFIHDFNDIVMKVCRSRLSIFAMHPSSFPDCAFFAYANCAEIQAQNTEKNPRKERMETRI
jgi:hypothetical protein